MIHYYDNTPDRRAALIEEYLSSTSNEIKYLYILTDPRGNPRSYVGYSNNPEVRLDAHMVECRSDWSSKMSSKEQWLWTLKVVGLRPTLTILGAFPASEIKMVENDAIMMDKAIRGTFNKNTQVRENW